MTAPADGPHRPQATDPHRITLTDAQFRTLGEAVRRSPSIGNTQPWRLRRLPDGLTILEDPARDLPGTDHTGRERTISCGTAILNARIAMRGLSLCPRVELCPEPHNDRVLANVRATDPSPPAQEDLALLRMIPRRHTHHRIYRSHAIAEEDLLTLRESVTAEGARLTVADSPARRRLAELLPETAPSRPTTTLPAPTGDRTHKKLVRSTILIISTAGDTRHDWIVAGLALERLLLTAGLKGLVATFGEQHLQDNTMRPRVANALRIWGVPQTLLRIGRALVDPPKTPRRPLSDLLEP
jgi:hypothetical protein